MFIIIFLYLVIALIYWKFHTKHGLLALSYLDLGAAYFYELIELRKEISELKQD